MQEFSVASGSDIGAQFITSKNYGYCQQKAVSMSGIRSSADWTCEHPYCGRRFVLHRTVYYGKFNEQVLTPSTIGDSRGQHQRTGRCGKFRRRNELFGRVLNPAVKGLSKLGLRTAMATELGGPSGRKTGQLAARFPFSCNSTTTGRGSSASTAPAPGGGRNIVDNP